MPLSIQFRGFRGRDGYSLIISATDGTIATMVFEPSELGNVVPEDEFAEMLRKHYGDILKVPTGLTIAGWILKIFLTLFRKPFST